MKVKVRYDSSEIEKEAILLFNQAKLLGKLEFIKKRTPLKDYIRWSVQEDMMNVFIELAEKELQNVC